MKKLIIDTSSELCVLAIFDEDQICIEKNFLHKNDLCTSLFPALCQLLDESSISLDQIDQFAVGVGPGSYIGTRTGVTVAKTLSFALNKHIIGFCSLLLFLPNCEGRFACVKAAKLGHFFLLKGIKKSQCLTLTYSSLIDVNHLIEELRDVDFVTAKDKEEWLCHSEAIKISEAMHNFVPFELSTSNIKAILALPCAFTFEKNVDLIYLHTPH